MSFDPITLMTIGQVVSSVSALASGFAGMQASNYQAAVAARNSQIAEENARRAIEQTQREQADWGESARGQLGALAAAGAASGVLQTGGSGALALRGAHRLTQRDSERIGQEGRLQADNFYQQAADFTSDARMARRRGRSELFGGALGAAGTYISHATQITRSRGLLAQ
jgi:hypothetical protein